ncbi:MAG: hypothetical protein IJ710_02000 [Prevotella sp.]|nr:hypothetical protein [Prevotella sp.]
MAALVVAGVAWLGVQCTAAPTAEEQAAEAARTYYGHLADGRYADYLSGVSGADSLPEAYREQLLVGAKQFRAQQQAAHRGIREVRVATARRDSALGVMNAFLVLCFGDSTSEEVCVPMVERDGRWLMR